MIPKPFMFFNNLFFTIPKKGLKFKIHANV